MREGRTRFFPVGEVEPFPFPAFGLNSRVMPDQDFLPSPYIPHACGLMHLPRMLEKIRRHCAGTLSADYEKTLGRGFDDLLCQHVGVAIETFVEIVRDSPDGKEVDARLRELFPADLKVHAWNRKLVQRGLSGYSKERLDLRKAELNLTSRDDIITMCDLLEVAEGRMP
jgi:hypothetical protein